jgi:hypothetical protein
MCGRHHPLRIQKKTGTHRHVGVSRREYDEGERIARQPSVLSDLGDTCDLRSEARPVIRCAPTDEKR